MQTPRQGLKSLMTMPLIGCLLMTQAYAAAPFTTPLRDIVGEPFKMTTTLSTVDVGGKLMLDWMTVVTDFDRRACSVPLEGCIEFELFTFGQA